MDICINFNKIVMKTDSEIQKQVMEELKWEPILNATEIGVAVKHGVVTLSGQVSTYSKKAVAQRAAWRVKGVKAVAIDLEVVLSNDNRLPDTLIAENVLSALKWHTSIPDEKLKVKVEDGQVSLEGEVEWGYQKDAAMNAVRWLKGVKGIISLITVKPRVDIKVIKDNITKALERRADIESNGIKIEALGNKIILKGKVHSWSERVEVGHAAWSAPGVSDVDDQIVIDYY
ncbi:MAG: BON domain-containing protein [Mucilaginibacter sp.]|uniref:BON domain-containing protein n=1 Tax=Mucilaginibacter sp. TaxID=1882438 RepID=UPI0031A2A5E5